jgi:hypothetical protein
VLTAPAAAGVFAAAPSAREEQLTQFYQNARCSLALGACFPPTKTLWKDVAWDTRINRPPKPETRNSKPEPKNRNP